MTIKRNVAISLFCVTAFTACATPEEETSEEPETTAEKEVAANATLSSDSETTQTEAEGTSDSPETNTIEGFAEVFAKAVREKDAEKVAELSIDPLPLGETGESVSKENILTDFDTYFAPELGSMTGAQLEKLTMIDEYADRYNTPVGEDIYQYGYKQDSVSQTWVFGQEADGEFKLRSLIRLQH